jgi:hypothetical protein
MLQSSTFTIPLLTLVATTSIAVTPPKPVPYRAANAREENMYHTISANNRMNEFAAPMTVNNVKSDAMNLYGDQSNFTADERRTYESVMERKSVSTGLNIFDILKARGL